MSEATSWPEQEAVENWLKKHGIEVDNAVSYELKKAVTKERVRLDKRICAQKDKIEALESEVSRLREGLVLAIKEAENELTDLKERLKNPTEEMIEAGGVEFRTSTKYRDDVVRDIFKAMIAKAKEAK